MLIAYLKRKLGWTCFFCGGPVFHNGLCRKHHDECLSRYLESGAKSIGHRCQTSTAAGSPLPAPPQRP